jgi:hypothetical protein
VGDASCPGPLDDDERISISPSRRCAPLRIPGHGLLNQHSGLPTLQLASARIDLDAGSEARSLVLASGEDLAHCKAIGPIRQATRTCKATSLQSSLPNI